jgi:hypothetical protein
MARESTIGSVFMLELLPQAAGLPLTGATKAAKAVITATNTLAKGDWVVISGTGMRSLDRKGAHRVSVVSGTSFTVDTSTLNDVAAATTGTFRKLTFQEVCFAEFGIEASAPGEIDVTTMCDLERRNVAGLSSPGTASFGGPMDLADVGQQKLLAAFRDGLARNMIWTTRGGQSGILYGVVSAFAGAPQGVEQAVTFNGSFQIQESPFYLEPMV